MWSVFTGLNQAKLSEHKKAYGEFAVRKGETSYNERSLIGM
jgi:hypothetical protein